MPQVGQHALLVDTLDTLQGGYIRRLPPERQPYRPRARLELVCSKAAFYNGLHALTRGPCLTQVTDDFVLQVACDMPEGGRKQ